MSATQSVATHSAGKDGEAAGGGRRNLGLALAVIATAQLMVVLDATIVNVALPSALQAPALAAPIRSMKDGSLRYP